MLKRDWGDLILIMKGSLAEYLEEERDLLLDENRQQVAKTRCQLTIGVGISKKQIAESANRLSRRRFISKSSW